MDSFYEYLLKSYVLFEEKSDLEKFLNVYKAIKSFMRRGRRHCNQGFGPHPFYVNVNMESGDTFTQWTDSLQAAMPGLQVECIFTIHWSTRIPPPAPQQCLYFSPILFHRFFTEIWRKPFVTMLIIMQFGSDMAVYQNDIIGT